MKKIMTLLVVAVLSISSANAQKENDLVVSTSGVKNITLGDNMDVVLITSKDNPAGLRLSNEAMKKLNISVYGSSMQVEQKRSAKKETLYLLVDQLQSLTLGQNTNVTSSNVILSGKIDLFVNSGATANLKTKSKIDVYSVGDIELDVIRRPLLETSTTLLY